MNDEAAFLQAMQKHPKDNALRLVFADWLEEHGDPRGELVRLLHTLTQSVKVPGRKKLEDRLRSLLAAGVQPVGPFWTNSIGMKFAWIPAGTFLMGSPENEEGRDKKERQHQVTLTKGFFLAIHTVSQAALEDFRVGSRSRNKSKKRPVTEVAWEQDCQFFLQELSKADGHAYRLPTEAEWEYACRAGTTTPFHFGETISTEQANYNGNYPYGKGTKGPHRGKTTPAGSFPPNAFGLYDMHGNVWEWCADWFGNYPKGDVIDPQGPADGDERVMRGGSFNDQAKHLRSANRVGNIPTFLYDIDGFRAARTFP
jgi:sulfatase modifying factor 1